MDRIITIKLNNVSREEQQELRDYLEENCWNWGEDVIESEQSYL